MRARLWELLGNLPTRPEKLAGKTFEQEDRGHCILERFQFDNGAGAIVPGCLLIPKKISGKAPGILYCHWHDGQHDIGKEELFGTNAIPVTASPELPRRGPVVSQWDVRAK